MDRIGSPDGRDQGDLTGNRDKPRLDSRARSATLAP